MAVFIALDEEYRPFADTVGVEIQKNRFSVRDMNGDLRTGIVHCISDMGPGPAYAAALRLIEESQPSLVIVIGLAGQLDDVVKLGDIVLATEVDNYAERSKVVSDPDDPTKISFDFGGKTLPASGRPGRLLEELPRQHPNLFNEWKERVFRQMHEIIDIAAQKKLDAMNLFPPKTLLFRGPIASGPFVVGSAAFKKLLKDKNRNLLAMEMESGGVLSGAYDRDKWPTTLVMRVISDPADERKKDIDRLVPDNGIRRWALHNVYTLLAMAFRRLPLWPDSESRAASASPDLAATAHTEVSVPHLPNAYRDEPSAETLHAIATYVQVSSATEKLTLDAADPWRSIANLIYECRDAYPLRIAGDSGTGKTTFLSALYWYLKSRADADADRPVPIFLNAQQFDDRLDDGATRRTTAQLQNDITNNLTPVVKLIESGRAIVIIIDGLDDTARFRRPIEDALLTMGASAKRKIVGVNIESRETGRGFRPALQNPQAAITLLPVSCDSPYIDHALRAFCAVTGAAQEPLAAKVKELELDTIDWATLAMLRRAIMNVDYQDCRNLTDIYTRWCMHERMAFGDAREALLPLAELAYEYTFEREKLDYAKVDARNWRIV
ncbi:MAG TPA: NACHT domain-containing protein, partial [Thermoanaerobaculia bacterium]|nr:NACHT domain-containing protein [Thermoanaerobaculia bacterium]